MLPVRRGQWVRCLVQIGMNDGGFRGNLERPALKRAAGISRPGLSMLSWSTRSTAVAIPDGFLPLSRCSTVTT